MTGGIKPHYEVVVIGAGVSGIYQIKRLADLGVDALVLDAAPDLGGTWYWNRYTGARFDSESWTYGYSFSRELLDEWHWKEHFSGQPEHLRYLNPVAAKFGLPVWPHAGGVGLCEYVQHLSMIDYVAVSGTKEGRVIEYVDHLHEHFLDPCIISDAAYMPPHAPGFSIEMKPQAIAEYLHRTR